MGASGYKDYFNVLGLQRDASSADVKNAFRKLARKFHPDLNSDDPMAEENFKEVNEAYEVLSDPAKRRKYEQFGQYWNQAGAMPGNGTGFDVDFGRYGNFDDFINELLGRFGGAQAASTGFPGGFSGSGGFPRSQARSPANLDAEVVVTISFKEAFRGAQRTLSVNEERVQVVIPKGIKTGSRLRLKGKGNSQPGTGRRGDLYLKLKVETHPIWHLDGDQLCAEFPVSLEELVLGAVVTVITPDGEVELTIPARTALGKSFRLKGKGWPSSNGYGDLLLKTALKLPSSWTEKELELLQEIKSLRKEDPRASWLVDACL